MKLNHLISVVCVAAAIALFTWLSGGSSNKAQQKNWINEWQATSSFQYPRRAPAAIAYNGFLYLLGGVDGDQRYIRTVEFAAINPDGSLGPWQPTSPLIEGRFYNSAIAHNGYLYTLGGGAGELGNYNYPIATVERAKINPDGSLSQWQPVAEMELPRRGLKAVLHNNTIYAIGGYDGRFLKSTERSTIQANGDLSPWQLEKEESNIDRYIHSSAIYNNIVYLLGGHMQSPDSASYGDVELSRISDLTTLSAWQVVPQRLLTSRLVAESFVLNNHLYIAGGHTGGERLTSVEKARINPDGSLQKWNFTTPLPIARSAYAVATAGHFVYVLGGAGDQQPLNTVHFASANQRGDLGIRQ